MFDRDEILRLAAITFKRQLQETEGTNLVNYIIQNNISSLPGVQALLEKLGDIFDRLKPINATVLDAIRIKNLAEKYTYPVSTIIKKIKKLYRETKDLNPSLSIIIGAIEQKPHDKVVYQVGLIVSSVRRRPRGQD